MSIIQSLKRRMTNLKDRFEPVPEGSIVLGRTPGSCLLGGHRVYLTEDMIRAGVTIEGGSGAGMYEAYGLVVDRLLKSGKKVLVLSDEPCSHSLFKYVMGNGDNSHSKQFILVSSLNNKDESSPFPSDKTSSKWEDSDFIGINYWSLYQDRKLSNNYLARLIFWAKEQWPDRVIIFIGSAYLQSTPILDKTNFIVFCISSPMLKFWICPTDGGRILMRSEGRDDGHENPEIFDRVSRLMAGDAIAMLPNRPVEQFRFDYLPLDYSKKLDYSMQIIENVTGDSAGDIRAIEAKRA